ncbi:hypothetical protein GCM10017771_02490 [Streptomyces capitiformicae]|uniref:Uncharacterized protein n=1 Tax=Streptomyces capitiformicae TaxID=2014920 RepID=A0A919GB00_9ACTN|nr:hypothetical protein GCM10017771_02490 [Streptomyces capitiformicae]
MSDALGTDTGGTDTGSTDTGSTDTGSTNTGGTDTRGTDTGRIQATEEKFFAVRTVPRGTCRAATPHLSFPSVRSHHEAARRIPHRCAEGAALGRACWVPQGDTRDPAGHQRPGPVWFPMGFSAWFRVWGKASACTDHTR